MKGDLLLVIDTWTGMAGTDGEKGSFVHLQPESRISARYRMGWDALHALELKEPDE